MDHQLQKIEEKLDKLHDKLDSYNARLVRVETSMGWIKYGLSILIALVGAAATALGKYTGH